MNDLKFAFRQLLKNSGFTAVAVLSLSLGIAANTTIFGFVNALLLRPPPVQAPDELWQVWGQQPKAGSPFERYRGLSYPGYAYLRDQNQSFVSLAAFDPETPFVSWNREGVGQSIQCQFVSGNFFAVCGAEMFLGRAFTPAEDRHPGAVPVAVVSERFWKNSLGSNPQAVGRTLTINGVDLTILGVAPDRFKGLVAGLAPELWAPFMMAPTGLHDPEWHKRTGAFSHFGAGRLKPGVSAKQAEAELTALTRQFEELDPKQNRGLAAAVFPTTMVPMPFRGFVRAFTGVFMGAVFMVLLIACANAANLMLARAVARRREMAVRSSIGASRARLMRQLLTESVLLALLGGGVGVLLTYWFVPVLMRLTPPTLPIRPEVGLDVRVFAEVNLKDCGYSTEQIEQFNERFLERVAALPGVQSVCFANYLPLDTRYLGISFNVEGRESPPDPNGFPFQTFDVGPNYFATLGTTLLKGREFDSRDRKDLPQVAVINRALADQFWPGQDAVGRHLFEGKPGERDTYEIIGVVENGKYRTLGENPRPVVFRCRLQHPGSRSTFVAHVRGHAQTVLAAMPRAQQEIDSRLSFSRLGTLEQHLSLTLFPTRTSGLLFSVFAAAALLLAVSGLFGVIAYSVSQRTREIGIRIALGASRRTVMRMVLRRGMTLACAGIGLGLAGAFTLTRVIRSLLFGVGPTDPMTFIAIPVLLAVVALFASWLPARRAAKVDPMEALRYE